MPPIGDTLRRERLRRNLALPQVAEEIKISSRFLQLIEEEKFDKLPATIFVKNFVRQYALFLELDGDDLALQAQRLLEEQTAEPEPPPGFKPDLHNLSVDIVKPWDASGVSRGSGSSWITAAAIFVAAMLLCSAAYWWWERPHQTVARAVPPPAAKAAAQPPASQPAAAAPTEPVLPPSAAPQGETASQSAAPQQTATQSAAPSAAAAPVTPGAESNPNASVRVEITALEAVWVRARVNGKPVFAVTLKPHEIRNVDADGMVDLLLGNAGGASITLNGKPLSVAGLPAGTAGPRGQVRTVQLTSGGFHIVLPNAP